jgi:hypothetical protein
MIESTASEIQSFKEMNDSMFKKIMELNSSVQVEYDGLVKVCFVLSSLVPGRLTSLAGTGWITGSRSRIGVKK